MDRVHAARGSAAGLEACPEASATVPKAVCPRDPAAAVWTTCASLSCGWAEASLIKAGLSPSTSSRHLALTGFGWVAKLIAHANTAASVPLEGALNRTSRSILSAGAPCWRKAARSGLRRALDVAPLSVAQRSPSERVGGKWRGQSKHAGEAWPPRTRASSSPSSSRPRCGRSGRMPFQVLQSESIASKRFQRSSNGNGC